MMHKTKIISLTVFLAFLNSCSLSSKTSVGHRKSQPKRLAVDKILKIPSRDAVDFSNLKSQQPFKKNVNSKKQRSLAQEERGETTNYQLATSNSLVAMLPTQSLKRGVREYLQMIGLESYEYDDFGGQNSGLIAYNQNLMSKNSCFAKLVSYFYFNINKKNTEHLVNYPPTPTYLFENLAVSTKNLNIPSGWVWNYAQDITRNDPNLSMSLLGICGHDNTAQLGDGEEVCVEVSDSYSSCDSKANTLPFFDQNHAEQYPQLVQQHINLLLTKWQPQSDVQRVMKAEVFENDYVEELKSGLSCPFLGPFYLQGSMGEETILDSSLIKEITNIQAPTKGAKFLPSKYYHTLGAAFTSCSMVRNNIPPLLIRKIQSVAVNTYRMNRLCEMYNESDSELPDMTKEEIVNFVKDLRDNPSLCILGVNEEDKYRDYDWEKPICNFLQDFDSEILGSVMNQGTLPAIDFTDFAKKIERKLHLPLAQKIFKNAITKEQCFAPQITHMYILKLKEISESENFCEPDTSPESCKIARDIIKTWWIDFKWSEAQQMKGVDFAVQNCQPEVGFINSRLEEKSCEILNSL